MYVIICSFRKRNVSKNTVKNVRETVPLFDHFYRKCFLSRNLILVCPYYCDQNRSELLLGKLFL